MARLQGITGGLSGKMGSAVFRQRGGETIAAQYQPQVKNPNTEGQQKTRAAFKLISQLAAIMAPGFGTMGVVKRGGHGRPSQRNGFTQLNYDLIVTEATEQGVVAKIPMEQLKLTSSMRAYGSIIVIANQPGFPAGSVGVSIQNLDTSIKEGRIVLVGYGATGAARQAQLLQIVDVPVVDGAIEYAFEGLGDGDYTVLSFGLIPTASASSDVSLDNIHTPADEDFISAVALDALVSDGQLVETTTIGANVTVQSE